MSGTNSNILQSYNPNQQIGPDFGAIVANSQRLLQFKQQQDQVKQQNALMGVFQDPTSLDATGQPTPETLQKVTAINPQFGLQLRQNAMIQQERQLRTQAVSSKLMADKMNMIGEGVEPIMESYDAAIKAGTPPEQAQRDAQAALMQTNERLKQSGIFTEDDARRFPTTFDPIQMRNVVAGTKQWQDHVKEQLAAQREAREEKHQTNADEAGQWHAGLGPDAKGNQVGGMWFTPKSGGEPQFHPGVTVTPSGGGSTAAATERDAETIARLGEKKEPLTPDEEKQLAAAKANVATRDKIASDRAASVTGAREGSTAKGKDHFAIESDVMREHPDWTPGQVAQETATRTKLASTLPGSVAADRAAIAKDVNDDPAFK